ncbi:HNH endonuclease signature motif containing protein [Streptomyces chartreusis]|uniref:HNH endonuclease signature motif containing protein n=1 Tax=Streptomyces chartreusis TaxID=1969 RepID=UPI0036743E13
MPAPSVTLYDYWQASEVPAPVLERFWSKVAEQENGCLTWQAQLSVGGYGVFCVRKPKKMYAHRFAYELLVGPIPDGLELDHLCRNRSCLNVCHLEPVTHAENRGRTPPKRHCPNGHEYTQENIRTWVKRDGVVSRACRECQHQRARAWRQRKRAVG